MLSLMKYRQGFRVKRDSHLWRNKETFSVFQSLENDPQIRQITRQTIFNFGPESIREFCYRLWPDGRTPENRHLSKVDWKQLEEAYDKIIFGIENKYELFP